MRKSSLPQADGAGGISFSVLASDKLKLRSFGLYSNSGPPRGASAIADDPPRGPGAISFVGCLVADALSRLDSIFARLCDGLARWARGGTIKPAEAQHLHALASEGRSEVRALVGDPTRDHISADLRRRVLQRDGFRCQMNGCSKPAAHVDHIVPVARYGASSLDNLRALCAACNLRKGAA